MFSSTLYTGSTPEPRAIIHLNVADFAVAVERVVDPRLRDRPVIIAPQGAVRAAVYDMSEEAYQGGVRKGMALARALRLVRDARVMSPHPDRYERAMRGLWQRVLPYSPLIEEGEGFGHLFIDTTGTRRLLGQAEDVAVRVRREVKAELGLDPIWSVAANKLVAKVATRTVKPDGENIVDSGGEAAFLGPLSVNLLPGLERDDLRLLRELHLACVRQVAALTRVQLQAVFGPSAATIYETVRGVDPSPVLSVGQPRPVVRAELEFAEDTNDVAEVERALFSLVERTGAELRRRRLTARRVGIALDYSDGVRIIRQATGRATASDGRLFALARQALTRAWVRRVRLRHLRLMGDRLIFPPTLLELFAEEYEEYEEHGQHLRDEQIDVTLDRIRGRFGGGAIQLGRTLPLRSAGPPPHGPLSHGPSPHRKRRA